METRYIISAQYMLIDGIGKGDILLYNDKKPRSLHMVENCISIDIKTNKSVEFSISKENIVRSIYYGLIDKKIDYGFDISEKDIDVILKAVKDEVINLDSNTTMAHTVSREIVKKYDQIDRFSVYINANNYHSEMLLICYRGNEKKNEYNMNIWRGDVIMGGNNWNGDYFFQMNDLPKEVKEVIVEKIDSLMKEMDGMKEPVFSLNREFTL